MAILPSSLTIPRPPQLLSSLRALTGPEQFRIPTRLSIGTGDFVSSLTIRMGGGPRTYPGGVSKWQWKRMQAKKAKQLLKARLCRERQIYEMRKRAELKAAVSELERPWEIVERAPTLFSVKADEQLKVLADRFQKPGGFDMWSERDGPQIFRPYDGLPSARFFPKGVVHSVKPYGVIADSSESAGLDDSEDGKGLQFDDWIARGKGGSRRTRRSSNRRGRILSEGERNGETGDLVSISQVAVGSYSNLRDSGVSSGYDREERNAMEGKMLLGDDGYGDFSRGREDSFNLNLMNSRVSSGFINEEGNAVEHKSISRENVREDYRRRRENNSSFGNSRNSRTRRHRSENSYGSDSDSTSFGKVERGRMLGSRPENVASRRFNNGKHSFQAKHSQTRNSSRSFKRGEDHGFGN